MMVAVEAGFSGASVSFLALGRALFGTVYIKHKIKRMDRLAGNRDLNIERMALYDYDPVVISVPAHAR